jgi:hypothetical protein
MRTFAPPPMNGMFTTTRAKVIEQCVKAHRAAKYGGFVGIRGYPCMVTKIEFAQDGLEVHATIHYRRIRDKQARVPMDMVSH